MRSETLSNNRLNPWDFDKSFAACIGLQCEHCPGRRGKLCVLCSGRLLVHHVLGTLIDLIAKVQGVL